MLLKICPHHLLDPVILLGRQLSTIIELTEQPLSVAQSTELLSSFEQPAVRGVKDLLGIASCFYGFEGAEVFALFLF